MNLFGGFKAKFTRKSKSKDNFEHVVCTKYKIHSEFLDDEPILYKHNPRIRQTKPKQPQETHKQKHNRTSSQKEHSKSLSDLRHLNHETAKKTLTTPTPLRKTESVSLPNGSTSLSTQKHLLIKTRPPYPLPEPDIHEYEEPVDSPTKIKTEEFRLEEPPPTQSSKTPFLLMKPNEYDEPVENTLNLPSPSDQLSDTKGIEAKVDSIKHPSARDKLKTNSLYLDGILSDKKSFNLNNTLDDYEEITPGEEYKETFSLSDKDMEPSTLILMTQPSEEMTPDTSTTTFQFINGFSNEPEEEFKVNIVEYDHRSNYSLSEDGLSMDGLDNDELKGYTPMGYSSQAASIFFGVDLEQPTPKPRHFMLKSTTTDEEDC